MESQSEKKDAHGIEFPRVGTILSKLWGSIAVNNLEDTIIRDSIQRIGAADPANVQLIAASQLELLAGYHQIAAPWRDLPETYGPARLVSLVLC